MRASCFGSGSPVVASRAASTPAAARAPACGRRSGWRGLVAEADCAVVEPGQHEGLRVGAEQAVQRGDQRLAGALVVRPACTRPSPARAPAGRCAGRRCESCRSPASGRRPGTAARRLRRRSVLKIANCSGSVSWNSSISAAGKRAFSARGEPGRVAAGEPLVQVEQHVVEGDDAPPALGAAQRLAAFGQQLAQQRAGGSARATARRSRAASSSCCAAAKNACSGAAAALLRLELARCRTARSCRASARGERVGAGEQRVPAARRGLHRLGLVAARVERGQRVEHAAARSHRAAPATARVRRRAPSASASASTACGEVDRRRPQRKRQRLGEMALEQRREPGRRVLALDEVGGERRRRACRRRRAGARSRSRPRRSARRRPAPVRARAACGPRTACRPAHAGRSRGS